MDSVGSSSATLLKIPSRAEPKTERKSAIGPQLNVPCVTTNTRPMMTAPATMRSVETTRTRRMEDNDDNREEEEEEKDNDQDEMDGEDDDKYKDEDDDEGWGRPPPPEPRPTWGWLAAVGGMAGLVAPSAGPPSAWPPKPPSTSTSLLPFPWVGVTASRTACAVGSPLWAIACANCRSCSSCTVDSLNAGVFWGCGLLRSPRACSASVMISVCLSVFSARALAWLMRQLFLSLIKRDSSFAFCTFKAASRVFLVGSSVAALSCCFRAVSGFGVFVGAGDLPPAVSGFLKKKTHTERWAKL